MKDEWKYIITLQWKDPITNDPTGSTKFPICVEYDQDLEEYIKGWKSRNHRGEKINVTIKPVFDKNKKRKEMNFELCAYAQ